MNMNITDIPLEIFGLHLSRTVKSKIVQTSKHFDVLRKPLERYFAFSHPTFIRLYINLLDSVKTKNLSRTTIDKAKLDYSNGIRNVILINTLILYYLKKQSGNFIFKIYELYKDHLSLLYENEEYNEVKIRKVFSIIYEFAKLYLMIHFVNKKSINKNEFDDCIMTVVSGISQTLEDTKNTRKYMYFQKLFIVINYIQHFNKATKNERLYKFIKDLYVNMRSSNRVINLETNSEKVNYDACIAFLLDRSNHKFF